MNSILHKQFQDFVIPQPVTSRAKRLLDINSGNRNRKLYPLPSTFEIPFSSAASGNNAFNSQNPVALAFPVQLNQLYGALGGPATTVTLNSSSSANNHAYSNMYLEHQSTSASPTYVKILRYNGTTKIATLESAITVGAGDRYSLRYAQPIQRNTLSAVTSSTNVTIPAAGATKQITNMYLFIETGTAAGSYAIISEVNSTTGVLKLVSPLAVLPSPGDYYNIFPFSYDSYSPLLYNGTTTNNSPVCYNIVLVGVSIPNTLIENGYRSVACDYPFFYIRLYNSNAKVGGSNIYSNNPGSELACFKVIPYTSRTDTSFFIYVVPEVQTISIRIDDNLYFELTLPDGSPVVWQEDDNEPPAPINPFLQISATFQVERLAP